MNGLIDAIPTAWERTREGLAEAAEGVGMIVWVSELTWT